MSSSFFLNPNDTNSEKQFSELMPVASEGFNLLVKAKRYGRWFLLKGLKPQYRDQQLYNQLLDKEFDILIELQHQNIAEAYSWEEVPGLGRCIVMEWVDGQTLREWLSQEHSTGERLRIAYQLVEALKYVHGAQTVHRDLNPENIMVTRSGQNVKLIDFGLSDTDSHAILKQPAGTEGYLSPEQMEQWQTDVRNDIYSLGCVLRDLQLPRLYRPVVNRCMAEEGRRYETAEAVGRALRRRQRLPYWWTALGVAAVVALAFVLLTHGQNLKMSRLSATADSLSRQLKETRRMVQIGKGGISMKDEGDLAVNEAVAHGLKYTCYKDWAELASQGAAELPDEIIIADSVVHQGRLLPVKTIKWHAFWHCTSEAVSIYIPRTVATIEDGAFDGMASNVERFDVDGANDNYCSVGGVLFNKGITDLIHYAEGSGNTTYEVPPSVRVIHGSAFAGAKYLETVVLGDSVQVIGAWAFVGCPELSRINIPKSVVAIGRNAFEGCRLLPAALIADPLSYRGKSSLDK